MRVPIVFATNDKYVPYCRVAIFSLLEHADARNEYVIYIFHSGLSDASVAALTALGRENARVEPVNVEALLDGCMYEMKWYTREIYYRLMAAEALPQEDKILYLDCDIVVLEDVARLYAVELGDNLIGALLFEPESAQRMTEALGVPVGFTFNSGVMLFNLAQWRACDVFGQCVEVLRRFQGRLRYPDQDALAIVCGHRATNFDARWNGMTCLVNRHGVFQDGIVHLFSRDKPWNAGGDTNYALYYAYAGRLGLLPPAPAAPTGPDRVAWVRRHLNGVRPAPVRALVKRAGALGCRLASAYVPRMRRYIKRVRVCVTTRCPGSCAHCEALCPHYAGRPDVEPKKLLDDLARLFHYTRGIGELRLTGGEPLGWEGLSEALRFALQSGHVRGVVVETPGLIAPSPEVMELLRDRRVGVEMHGGVDVVNPNIAYFLCDKPAPVPLPPALRDVPGAVHSQEWVWADFGAFERRDVTDEALYWQARACGVDDYYYLNGRLYPCARMAHGAQLGMLPEAACRFADLRAARGAWRAARALEELFQRAPAQACRYCLRGTTDFLPVPPEI